MKILSCKEATRLVSRGLDQRLPFGERVSLRVHLLICDGCTNFSRQVAFIRKALARLAQSPDSKHEAR